MQIRSKAWVWNVISRQDSSLNQKNSNSICIGVHVHVKLNLDLPTLMLSMHHIP